MKRAADASIVFNSDVAHHGKACWGAYAAAKAGRHSPPD